MNTRKAIDLFIESRKAENCSPNTILWYQGILSHFTRHFTRLPSRPENIEHYMAGLTCGDERKHGYWRAIKAFYNFIESRYEQENPFRRNILPPRVSEKVPRILSPKEINNLLFTSEGEIKAAILFLIDTGARISEYVSLKIEDLHENDAGFTCVINGKTGEREIPISYETYHALMVTPRWKHSSRWLGRIISRKIRETGVNASAHNLRHTFGTLWDGEDELVLQKIMGHSNIETTKRYRQIRMSRLQEQHRQYSPLKMVLSASKSML